MTPVIFGMPTVLNVFTYIPLLMCSALNYSAYYALASSGMVGRFYLAVPFTVPVPLQAFLSTMDWKTVPLVLVLLVADYFVCLPFITAYDRTLLESERSVSPGD